MALRRTRIKPSVVLTTRRPPSINNSTSTTQNTITVSSSTDNINTNSEKTTKNIPETLPSEKLPSESSRPETVPPKTLPPETIPKNENVSQSNNTIKLETKDIEKLPIKDIDKQYIEKHENDIKPEQNTLTKKPITRRLIKPNVFLPPVRKKSRIETITSATLPPTPTSPTTESDDIEIKAINVIKKEISIAAKPVTITTTKSSTAEDVNLESNKNSSILQNDIEMDKSMIECIEQNENNSDLLSSTIDYNFKSPQNIRCRSECINSPTITPITSDSINCNPINAREICFNDENITKSPSSKTRQRIRPTPCFGLRRNSIQVNN